MTQPERDHLEEQLSALTEWEGQTPDLWEKALAVSAMATTSGAGIGMWIAACVTGATLIGAVVVTVVLTPAGPPDTDHPPRDPISTTAPGGLLDEDELRHEEHRLPLPGGRDADLELPDLPDDSAARMLTVVLHTDETDAAIESLTTALATAFDVTVALAEDGAVRVDVLLDEVDQALELIGSLGEVETRRDEELDVPLLLERLEHIITVIEPALDAADRRLSETSSAASNDRRALRQERDALRQHLTAAQTLRERLAASAAETASITIIVQSHDAGSNADGSPD